MRKFLDTWVWLGRGWLWAGVRSPLGNSSGWYWMQINRNQIPCKDKRLEFRLIVNLFHRKLPNVVDINIPLATYFRFRDEICLILNVTCHIYTHICARAHTYTHVHTYIYHHHHVALVARISLPLSHHSSLSFIALGRSSGQHPVSSHSYWMYVRAGRPAFARPCVGVHKSTSLMSSSLLLQQCPACLVCLTWLDLCREIRPTPVLNECSGYATKQSDGEAPVILEPCGMRSFPLLPSPPGPLWPSVIAPDKVLTMSWIDVGSQSF